MPKHRSTKCSPGYFPWCAEWEAELRKLFGAYVEAKQKQNVLDYDDLLLYWAQMMIERHRCTRYRRTASTMCWSTNIRIRTACRLQILLALKPNGRGLTVVGDDAQSIYSFRAATVRNILDFPGHFIPKAEIITLDRNYRSTQPILAAANAVIDLAAERFTKNLWSERVSAERPELVNVTDDGAQARYVVEQVLENRETGITLKSQAVLFRASHHSGHLEIELTRRNVPFVKFGGLKFLEASHIKDVLAVLRLAKTPAIASPDFAWCSYCPASAPRLARRAARAYDRKPDPIQAAVGRSSRRRGGGGLGRPRSPLSGMLRRLQSGLAGRARLARPWYRTPS